MKNFEQKTKKAFKRKCLKANHLELMGRGGLEPPTHGFSVRCNKNISPDNKETYAQGKTALSPPLSTERAPKAQNTPEIAPQIDPDLQAIIDRWQDLPKHIKQTIKTVAGITEK